MSVYNWGLDLSAEASVDLDNYQYHFVQWSTGTDRTVGTVSGCDSACILGVLQNDPDAGQEATVRMLGTTKLTVTGSVDAGETIHARAGGVGAKQVTATCAIHAFALEGTGTSSGCTVIEVFLLPPGAAVPAL